MTSWLKKQVNHSISAMDTAGMRAWELLVKPSQAHKNTPRYVFLMLTQDFTF